MVKICLYRFYANNENVVISDVIQNLKAGVTKEGIVNVHFNTSEKYINIDANVSIWMPKFGGKLINMYPSIYHNESNTYLEEDLFHGAYEQYLNHPDYYHLELIVDENSMGGRYFTSNVIALKHEYFVSFTPDNMVMNYDCLEEVEVKDCEAE